ncbi:MAG: hypothetical protein AAF098_19185 [Pseudomonadota bacterium]
MRKGRSDFLTVARSFLLVASCVPLLAAAEAPLFSSDDPLQITLKGPFTQIDRERDKEAEYPATLSYDADGETYRFDVKLSVRGNFRLQKKVCSYSQLWVNFKKSQVKNTVFADQNKLKLVVQCRKSGKYEEYLAREYQAYKAYEQLTDLSFKTRWLNVSYIDAEEGKTREHLGFFIEHQKSLAKRHDLKNFKAPKAQRARLDPYQSTLASVYMYLVSNTDYSLIAAPPGENCCHNVKLLEASNGVLFPVPYDFDSTGFVGASYAEPSAGINQRAVTQRIYRGYCVDDAILDRAVSQVLDHEEQITQIMVDSSRVSEKSAKRSGKYVGEFFAIAADEKRRDRFIDGKCR